MSADLREAVKQVRQHEADLTALVTGLLADIQRVVASANKIKRSLLSSRDGARAVVDALDEIEGLESRWDTTDQMDEYMRRRVAVETFRSARRIYDRLGVAEFTDEVVHSVALDVIERCSDLMQDIGTLAFGLAPDTLHLDPPKLKEPKLKEVR